MIRAFTATDVRGPGMQKTSVAFAVTLLVATSVQAQEGGGGMRQARTPTATPKSWPNQIDKRLEAVLDEVDSLVSATLLNSVPITTAIPGSPGATGYILELDDLAFILGVAL